MRGQKDMQRLRYASARLCAILGITVALISLLASCSAATTPKAQQAQPTSPAKSATPTVPPATNGISVQGTQLYYQGHAIALLGFNRTSLEYSCTGDGHLLPSDFQAMRKWGANTVRIPLSSEFWADAGGSCPTYRATVQRVVASARAAHLFVVLDLQWSAPFDTYYDRTHGGVQCPMPDTGKDAAMWQDLATLYSNDTSVLFDLYGEPYNVSWSSWRNGGPITEGCYIIGTPTAMREHGTYQAIGMQTLVDQIREIAPDNVIIVAGNNWGYDLAGTNDGYAIAGTNIAYDTHPFHYGNKLPSDWPRAFGHTAEKYPVIAAEFGSYDCQTGYVADAIDYFTAHHISWLAWSWQPGSCGGPSLLASWAGTPSAPYGRYIKQRMLAAAAAQS
jgi:endoglucanase